jgi:RNA polymerase sigma-70 factor (ECF subfamily)
MTAERTPAAEDPIALLDASFTGHRGAALALARRVLRDEHLAEDAVQLAFLQILVRVRRGDDALLGTNPRAVVLHGTRWAALKLVERDRDRHAAESLDESPSAAAADPWAGVDARLTSDSIIAALPPHYRDALVLRYLEDLPDERAAARLALTVKAYRRRLDRARASARLVATRGAGSLVALLPGRRTLRLRGWHLRVDARVRQVRARLAQFVGSPGFSHWAMIVAIATLSAGALAPVGGSETAAAHGLVAHATDAARPSTLSPSPGRVPGAVAGRQPAGPQATPALRPTATPRPTGLIPLLDPPPPDQVAVTTVVPAPHYERTHTVVLEGNGYLYQSKDGGATWESWTPPVVGTVVLPPAYPDDPRILVNTSGGAFTNNPVCMVAAFGGTTCTPLPLLGSAAFGARFDSGNPVVYGWTSERTGFVAYDVETHLLRPIVRSEYYPLMQVVTPSTDSGPDVYLAYMSNNQDLGPLTLGQPGYHSILDACDVHLVCHTTSVDTLGYWVSSDREDRTGSVLAGPIAIGIHTMTYGVSLDQGRTYPLQFETFTGTGSGRWGWDIVGSGRQVAVYFSSEWDSAPETLLRRGVDGTVETLTLPRENVSHHWISVTALTSRRLMAYDNDPAQPGFWCSLDGGHTWRTGCPAER